MSEKDPDGKELTLVGGELYGNWMWNRYRRTFRIFDLQRSGPPKLLFHYAHPWRLFSSLVVDRESAYVLASETGMGQCRINEVGVPLHAGAGVDEATALSAMATCYEEQGQVEKAIGCLKEAVVERYNLPDLHRRLMRLLKRAGRMGECSREAEILIDLAGLDSPQGQEAFAVYKEVLGWREAPTAPVETPMTLSRKAVDELDRVRWRAGGALWKGGPVLCRSRRGCEIGIAHPVTGKLLCQSTIGAFQSGWRRAHMPYVFGDRVRVKSDPIGKEMFFQLNTFCRAVGWTEALDRQYRKELPQGDGASWSYTDNHLAAMAETKSNGDGTRTQRLWKGGHRHGEWVTKNRQGVIVHKQIWDRGRMVKEIHYDADGKVIPKK
ncbi:MAG: tetratricopeptide repeat protein [Planctomycetota bacterium]